MPPRAPARRASYGDAGARLDDALPGVDFTVLRAPWTQWWDQVSLPRALARDRPTVFLSPYYKMPLMAPCPVVLTIHDLYFIGYPGRHRPVYDATITRLARLYARRSAAIVTDSEYSRRAIAAQLGVSSSKVSVIPVALGPEFKPAPLTPAVAARYGVTPPYVLYVGNFMPHKNLACLIRAFALFPDAERRRHTLVLAGGASAGRPALARLAAELGVADRVIFPGRVDDQDLPSLYSGAAVYVSAVSRGGIRIDRPRGDGLRRAGGGLESRRAARGGRRRRTPVRSGREHDVAATLARIVTDAALADDLRRRALARAGLFTSARTSERVLELLRGVADRRGDPS